MGRAAQGVANFIAGGMEKKREAEIAGKRAGLDQAKVDALEEANRLKEKGIDAESAYKAYSLMAESEEKQYNRVRSAYDVLGGTVVSLKEKLADPSVSAEEKAVAKTQLEQANADLQLQAKRMVQFASKEPLTFDKFQEAQNKMKTDKAKANIPPLIRRPEETPETVKTSYYQSPAFQPPAYTAPGSDVTKTVAFGGSTKKVEVVGGRVSSVVSPNGTKSSVGGWVSEDALPAINQVVTALESSSAGEVNALPSGAETPATTPAPVEQRVELSGPLNSKYINSESFEPIEGSSNRDKRNGTIIYDERKSPSTGEVIRTPRVAFNSKYLQNVDGTENIDAHMSLRRLTMMNDVLKSGEYKDIKPDQVERDAADDAFGTKDNAFDMPAIRQAYAYVDRNLKNTGDVNATMWGSKFEQKYGMFPSEFMAGGDAVNELEITPSVSNALEATQRGRMAARIEEVGSAPKRPEGLDESLSANEANVAKIEESLKRVNKALSDPLIGKGPALDAMKNKQSGLLKELEIEKTKTISIQNRIQNFDVENKRYQQRADAESKAVAMDEAIMRLEKGKREEAQDIAKLVTRWVGISPTDWKKTNGFVAMGLKDIPRAMRKIPIVINGKDTGKFYSDRLDAPELLRQLEKNRDYATISRITRNMPTEEQLYDQKTGVYAQQKKFNESLYPLNELNRLNDKILSIARTGATGLVKAQFEKVWQSDTALSTSGGLQKTLIGAIREAVVGPGNPSNYEQEVIASIVPDVNEFMSRPERVKARIKALATVTMLNHYNNMVANGLEPTDLSLKMYSQQLGSVLGYEVTPDTFNRLYNDWTRQRTIYVNNESIGSPNSDLSKEYANRLIDSLEERAKPAK